jgi:hypothetical protein
LFVPRHGEFVPIDASVSRNAAKAFREISRNAAEAFREI